MHAFLALNERAQPSFGHRNRALPSGMSLWMGAAGPADLRAGAAADDVGADSMASGRSVCTGGTSEVFEAGKGAPCGGAKLGHDKNGALMGREEKAAASSSQS